MLENLVENLFKEPTYLDLVKDTNTSKETWEKHKQELLKEFEEVDKYFEEKEKEKEEKKPILTDEEREYLSVVIKPFRDDVEFIEKRSYTTIKRREVEYIAIDLGKDDVTFPNFEKGTMYEGMEAGKEYTLEELGL